jgi:Holliday junction DNA helicase, RuvA subunit
MYAYLQGTLTHKTPTELYIDVGGVGYHVFISLNTYGKVEALTEAKLFTHLYVKEDQLSLYGFFELEEKELFKLLISISGIGPNTARLILSSMTPLEVRSAIVSDNDGAFKKVKGVGPKTAKRVTLELKDKIKAGAAIVDSGQIGKLGQADQAIDALVALGFQRNKVQKVIGQLAPNETTENLVKLALQQLT